MYKSDFPLLMQNPNIHYLDSAATAQRPLQVIEGVKEYFLHSNGNAGRGSHSLAIASSILVEETRKKTAEFIGADKIESIIFTKNSTEALNIVAYCYGCLKAEMKFYWLYQTITQILYRGSSLQNKQGQT